ncbi:MAG TPA: choice-of-anchor tandem repeat GloVer-containing protein [Gammaproteobacteria bacterium]|nr:choice-of-anchor tandem repeat GloVer-containing protein [Gammaproteobacteria bacterium]
MQNKFTFGTAWMVLACVTALTLGGCGSNGSPSSTSSNARSYTVGGTVAGLGNKESVVLLINGGDQLSITANGPFVFSNSLPAGSSYQVTVKSHTSGIACVVGNGTGTVSSNVTGITVTCGSEVTLYSFGPAPYGVQPNAGLIMDNSGNLFGTTSGGGTSDCGMVFELSSANVKTVLHSFCSTSVDGLGPSPGLVMDGAGNLYGTTFGGGEYDVGTIFKVSPSGSETVLHSFGSPGADGNNPEAGLVMDNHGYLYGTTLNGGANGLGAVFKLGPTGVESVLYSFVSITTGGPLPNADTDLIMDGAGNLYGTTYASGKNGFGMVYKISPAGTRTILHSFGTGTDGQYPKSGLVLDSAGNLYGTTSGGGEFGVGTVYEISPSGTETVLYSFGSSGNDGADPQAGLVMDGSGNLYGTTYRGGKFSDGTVFEISSAGTETVLYSFGSSATDGRNPAPGRLTMDTNGNLYGTTLYGGAYNEGTVFEILN